MAVNGFEGVVKGQAARKRYRCFKIQCLMQILNSVEWVTDVESPICWVN